MTPPQSPNGQSGPSPGNEPVSHADGAGLVPETGAPVRPAAFDPTELLAHVWQQNAHIMRARVERLKHAAQVAQTGPLPPELRAEASDLAHKLAGSLGMFGYPDGTTAAQKIEAMLNEPGGPDAAELLHQTTLLRASVPL